MNPSFNKVTSAHLHTFRGILSEERVITNTEELDAQAWDYLHSSKGLAEVILRPKTSSEVSQIVSLCHKEGIPITPKGAGTSLCAGAISTLGGVLLDMTLMNSILFIDTQNRYARVQAGVITEALDKEAQKFGLFYPVDPASKGSSTLGGNIAYNSGGPRALKYGTTRNYILNLEVVLADGTLIETGADTIKYATGYNLSQLMIGSEGTLGIVTEALIRLLPYPTHRGLLFAQFSSAQIALEVVSHVIASGANPSAIEFMERDAISSSNAYLGKDFPLESSTVAALLIEADGFSEEQVTNSLEKIYPYIETGTSHPILLASTAWEQERLWEMRRAIGTSVKALPGGYIEEDTVVPPAAMPSLLEKVKALGKSYGINSICYGHAGDGNLHINLLRSNMNENEWANKTPIFIKEIFTICKDLRGTLSGEHGIGHTQKEYLDTVLSSTHITLMRGIKAAFDPKGILNPGKMLPDVF